MSKEYFFYTDASYMDDDRRGSWSYVSVEKVDDEFVYHGHKTGISVFQHGLGSTTLMELKAIHEAIKTCDDGSCIIIYSDSMASIKAIKRRQTRVKNENQIIDKIWRHRRLLRKRVMIEWISRKSNPFSAYADRICAWALGRGETKTFEEYEKYYNASMSWLIQANENR